MGGLRISENPLIAQLGEAMTVQVDVKGLKELEQALMELPRSTAKGTVRRAAKKALQPMADKAASIAPDDPATGSEDLHRSIEVSHRTTWKAQKAGRDEVKMFMGPNPKKMKRYASALVNEFGSFKMSAQPYMRPAWDAEAMPTLDRLKDALWAEVKKSVARRRKRIAKGK